MAPVDLRIPALAERIPYRSSNAVQHARMEALSYTSNPRNLESPFYGLNNQLLTELSNGVLVTTPQYCLHQKRDITYRRVNELLKAAKAIEKARPGGASEDASSEDEDENEGEGEDEDQALAPAPPHDLVVLAPNEDAQRVGMSGTDDVDPEEEGVEDEASEHGSSVAHEDELDAEGEGDSDHSDLVSVPDSMMSDSSSKAIAGFPDFVWTHSIIIDMDVLPDRIPELRPGKKPTTKQRRRLARRPVEEIEEDQRRRRYAQSYYLYGGKYLVHQAVLLIEEDKNNPPRRNHWTVQPNLDDEEITAQLEAAESEICQYLFIYFYLVNPHAQVVVARSTAGVFWRWTYFHRSAIPLYTMKSRDAPLKERHAGDDIVKQQLYRGKWAAQERFVAGTQASDEALTAMRDRVFLTIEDESPSGHMHGSPQWA